MPAENKLRRGALAWAMYDWGNSAFTTTVAAAFFPLLLSEFWGRGRAETVTTFALGLTVSAASLLVALSAPALGAIADRAGARKGFLIGFAVLAIVFTLTLAVIPAGLWILALACYGLSFVTWISSCVFYDSLIVEVTTPENVDRVSGLGFALGYLGGGILFALNVAATLKPQWVGLLDGSVADLAARISAGELGGASLRDAVAALAPPPPALAALLADPAATPERLAEVIQNLWRTAQLSAMRWSLVSVAVWWAVFSIPLLVGVRESGQRRRVSLTRAAREGWAELGSTLRNVRRRRPVWTFLLAYWLYIDAVDTIFSMSVKYGKSKGFASEDLVAALLMVQFVAFPFAYLFGRLGQRFGPRPFIALGLAIYLAVTLLATQLDTQPYVVLGLAVNKFFVLAFLVGTVQGGVQALSRSFYTRIIPLEDAAEFFGFYNTIGRFAAIIGPLLVGGLTLATGKSELGISSVGLLLLAGGGLLLFVRVPHTAPDLRGER